jgi:hypothetical protein
VKLSYTVPGGLAGRAVGRALEPIVALSIRHIDSALRRNVEVPMRNGRSRGGDQN